MKLYTEGAAALLNLNASGKKVFQIVYKQLYGKEGKGRTEIVLNHELLSDEEKSSVSKRTFERGITELINAGFIAESIVPSYYYINTAYLYNGDRLALVNEYVIKKHPKESFESKLEEQGQQKLIN